MTTYTYEKLPGLIKHKIYRYLPADTLRNLRLLNSTDKNLIEEYLQNVIPRSSSSLAMLALFAKNNWTETYSKNASRFSTIEKHVEFIAIYIALAQWIYIPQRQLNRAKQILVGLANDVGWHAIDSLGEKEAYVGPHQFTRGTLVDGLIKSLAHDPNYSRQLSSAIINLRRNLLTPSESSRRSAFLSALNEKLTNHEKLYSLINGHDPLKLKPEDIDFDAVNMQLESFCGHNYPHDDPVAGAKALYHAATNDMSAEKIDAALAESQRQRNNRLLEVTGEYNPDFNKFLALMITGAYLAKDSYIRGNCIDSPLTNAIIQGSLPIINGLIACNILTFKKTNSIIGTPYRTIIGESTFTYINDCLTPLGVAISLGKADIVDILINAGAPVINEEMADKDAFLHKALNLTNEIKENTIAKIVRSLIDAGIDVNRTENNMTPLEIATNRGFSSIINMLTDAGANANANADKASRSESLKL